MAIKIKNIYLIAKLLFNYSCIIIFSLMIPLLFCIVIKYIPLSNELSGIA